MAPARERDIQEGRDYLICLPNVAYSAIEDDQELADIMNFVVSGLAAKACQQEPGHSRRRKSHGFAPSPGTDSLIGARAYIVEKLHHKCGATDGMLFLFDPKPAGQATMTP